MRVRVYVDVHVRMRVYVHVRMYAQCAHVCMRICVWMCVCACAYMCACTCVCACAYMRDWYNKTELRSDPMGANIIPPQLRGGGCNTEPLPNLDKKGYRSK